MATAMAAVRWPTVVIGGGQAGLATGYHLARLGEQFAVLDRNRPAGAIRGGSGGIRSTVHSRRARRLARDAVSGRRRNLPDQGRGRRLSRRLRLPLELPVQGGVEVERMEAGLGLCADDQSRADLRRPGGGGHGHELGAAHSAFAGELYPSIRQLHSSRYKPAAGARRRPGGRGRHPGSRDRHRARREPQAHLSGRPTRHIPDALLRYAGEPYWWFWLPRAHRAHALRPKGAGLGTRRRGPADSGVGGRSQGGRGRAAPTRGRRHRRPAAARGAPWRWPRCSGPPATSPISSRSLPGHRRSGFPDAEPRRLDPGHGAVLRRHALPVRAGFRARRGSRPRRAYVAEQIHRQHTPSASSVPQGIRVESRPLAS